MKATKLVHPSYARTVLAEQDAARLRAQGWLELTESKSVSKTASWQRRFRQRCRESGLKQLAAWLPQETFDELMALKKENETTAELITRLLHSSCESTCDGP